MTVTDVVVVGAGAAGLMAAICAGRPARAARDRGRRRADARREDPRRRRRALQRHAPRGRRDRVRRLDPGRHPQGAAPVRRRGRRSRSSAEGVALKREDTGKLFPATDRARTVLDALLRRRTRAGVEIRIPGASPSVVRAASGSPCARTGVDRRRSRGAGDGRQACQDAARRRGLRARAARSATPSPRTSPGAGAARLPDGHFLRTLSRPRRAGDGGGARESGDGSPPSPAPVLCTHFGLSGPGGLDVSRHWPDARARIPAAGLVRLAARRRPRRRSTRPCATCAARRRARAADHMPERLARALLCRGRGDPGDAGHRLTREAPAPRRAALTELPVARGRRPRLHAPR